MAPISKTLALAGALFALTGYSAPVDKRAVVWEVVTDIVWTTVEVTVTVDPQATHTTVAPVVATTTTATTTTAAAVQALAQEPGKVAPTTTSSTTTAAATTTTVKEQEKAAPTTTSSTTTAAPVPTLEAYSAPAPVVEAAETSTTASAITRATNTETTGSSGHTGACSESSPCEGEITFYDTATTATNPSSCGNTNDGTVENVLALPHGIMKDSDCGKTVTITYNGQTATGIVVDKCMGCSNGDVDLSRHLFGELSSFSKGRVSGAKWYIH
ncbi:Barwin-related endoglucanase [Penicillium griseofulvum]|uniref:Barwin-related endoglucanase n=1 Tax=Penicillium patulum TaxID=5078 RepID=A0A135LU54_PENPA|nr:Barwin-related endoglucanase [Penicillium griseofulvum]KXG52485.1 Barwin-related endoglucanase [Penicillium griseofulvum]